MTWYRSKSLWLFGSVVGLPLGYWAYDRYEKRRIIGSYISQAKAYGEQPLTMVSMVSPSAPVVTSHGGSPENLSDASSLTSTSSGYLSSSSVSGLLQHRRFTLLAEGASMIELKDLFEDLWLKFVEP